LELLFIVQLGINNIGFKGAAPKEINFALRVPQFAVQTTLQIVTSKDLYNKVVNSMKAGLQKLF
jgi:hypothetical protein